MSQPICTEECPDPRDVFGEDAARKQFNRIDTCAKRYTHWCKHDHAVSSVDDTVEYTECYDVLRICE